MADAPSREELEAAHCWEEVDRVPGRPEITDFRRSLRQHQARWREANGHPIGSQPIVPREGNACSRYRALLVDQSTFASATIEELLDANVLPAQKDRRLCASGTYPAEAPRT